MARVRYQALGPLLAGEGSRAFLGLEISDGEAEARPIVLVWVPEEVANDPARLAAIEKETARAVQLIHPHILRVYGLAQVDDGLARIVEFADGETLRTVMDQAKKLPAPLACLIVADAATGIYFAHQAGNDDGTPLVHGDLRPETVMVSFNGLSTVTGYGALSVAPKEPSGKRVRGRRIHCAPEQLVGGRDAVRIQTDVYLLGLSLYEALTGTEPFADEEDFDQAVLTKPLPLLDSEDVPEALRPVIAKACAKKVTDRYPSAIDLREALEKALPLPPREELAAYLDKLFPSHGEVRAARRREIDAGIANFARGQWAKRKSGVLPPEPAAPPAPAPAPVKKPSGVTAPEPPAPAPPPEPPPEPLGRRTSGVRAPDPFIVPKFPSAVIPPPARRSMAPLALAVALGALLVAVLAVVLSRRSPPPSPAPAPPPPPAMVKPPPPPEVVDAGIAPPDAGAPADAGVAAVAPVGNEKGETSLELVVEPPTDVEIDGVAAGHAPLTVPLAAGKHRVVLSDKRKGISVTQIVAVAPRGRTHQEIHLGRGYVSISAPEGATVQLDGKNIGRAPLKGEISLYEGAHQVNVTVGKAKWRQAFTVKPGEHAYFNVETQ